MKLHPDAGRQVSFVQALLSLQVMAVNTHPVLLTQVSVVHKLLSLQVMKVFTQEVVGGTRTAHLSYTIMLANRSRYFFLSIPLTYRSTCAVVITQCYSLGVTAGLAISLANITPIIIGTSNGNWRGNLQLRIGTVALAIEEIEPWKELANSTNERHEYL